MKVLSPRTSNYFFALPILGNDDVDDGDDDSDDDDYKDVDNNVDDDDDVEDNNGNHDIDDNGNDSDVDDDDVDSDSRRLLLTIYFPFLLESFSKHPISRSFFAPKI